MKRISRPILIGKVILVTVGIFLIIGGSRMQGRYFYRGIGPELFIYLGLLLIGATIIFSFMHFRD